MKKTICVLIAMMLLLCSCSSGGGSVSASESSAPESASEPEMTSSAPETTRQQETKDWKAYADDFVPMSEDEAMSTTILRENADGYLKGECAGEGHLLIGEEEKDGLTWLYFRSWYSEFGFENGVFTAIAGGSGPVAASYKVEDGRWIQQSYAIALTGDQAELAAMFPADIIEKLKTSPTDEEIAKAADAEKAYAKDYLAFIGRDAEVSTDYVEKTLPDMPEAASNALVSDPKYSVYPNWTGTLERVEDGVRYVYETKWEGDSKNGGTLTLTKSDYTTNVAAEQLVLSVAADGTITEK